MSNSEGATGEENREETSVGSRDDGGYFFYISIHISYYILDIWGKLTDMIRACGEAVEESSAAKKRAVKVNVKVSLSKRTGTSGKRT